MTMSGNDQPSKQKRIGISYYSRNSVLNTRTRIEPWIFIQDKRMDIDEWEVLFNKIQSKVKSAEEIANQYVTIFNNSDLSSEMRLKVESGSTYGFRLIGLWNRAIATADATGRITHTKFAIKIQAAIIAALQDHVKENTHRPIAGKENIGSVVDDVLHRIFASGEFKGLSGTRATEIFKSVIDVRRITNKLNQLRTKKRLVTAFQYPTHIVDDTDNTTSYLLGLNGAVGYVCSIENIVEAILDYEVDIIEKVTDKATEINDKVSEYIETCI